MKPSRAIAMLDRQVANHGQAVTLRRIVPGSSELDASVRAVVRGYRPEQVTDAATVGSSSVTVSPTALKGTAFEAGGAWPTVGDRVVVDGRVRIIEAAEPLKIDDVVVRFNLVVAG